MKSQFILIVFGLVTICTGGKAAVQVLNKDNFDSVVDGSKNVLVMFYVPWCQYSAQMRSEYHKASEAFNQVNDVVIAEVDSSKYPDLRDRYHIRSSPDLKFFRKGSSSPEDYEGGRVAEDFVNFINEKAGTSIKMDTPTSHVVVLTADNFDQVVLNHSAHVLVKFYAPWGGHCKALAPKYTELANVYKDEPDIVIAKIDGDKYKDLAAKYRVRGFPQLMFFSKTDKSGHEQCEARDLSSLVAYVNEKTGDRRNEEGLEVAAVE